MNPVLLKSLVGVGVLGTTTAASVGGYYWLSSSAPKTIGEKIRNKTPINPYVESGSDSGDNSLWTNKNTSYASGASSDDEQILSKTGITAKKISDKCEEILKTLLSDSDAGKKEEWAKKWCFKEG